MFDILREFPATLVVNGVIISSSLESPPGVEIMSRIGTTTLLAILGMIFVLLFPAGYGPFTVTHGPATAFRAAAAVKALLKLVCGSLIIALLPRPALPVTVNPLPFNCASHASVLLSLRC
jgi:hypothetical protein